MLHILYIELSISFINLHTIRNFKKNLFGTFKFIFGDSFLCSVVFGNKSNRHFTITPCQMEAGDGKDTNSRTPDPLRDPPIRYLGTHLKIKIRRSNSCVH